ncbi:hypothetical protein SKAU_G00203370 [Synaphobranchus kaupii]|uniref:Uncharacterized protein n=1 Tax=Synaphobranchus kaupii TaxID=118154 RepID=A0A9Q1FFX6_SYNKA|nr:hypothetical protein SKAU_G00203370 [Synaphobranchus kaupii]
MRKQRKEGLREAEGAPSYDPKFAHQSRSPRRTPPLSYPLLTAAGVINELPPRSSVFSVAPPLSIPARASPQILHKPWHTAALIKMKHSAFSWGTSAWLPGPKKKKELDGVALYIFNRGLFGCHGVWDRQRPGAKAGRGNAKAPTGGLSALSLSTVRRSPNPLQVPTSTSVLQLLRAALRDRVGISGLNSSNYTAEFRNVTIETRVNEAVAAEQGKGGVKTGQMERRRA